MRGWKRISILVLGLFIGLLTFVYFAGRLSLPARSGSFPVSGLTAAVSLKYDSFGVPLIQGQTIEDVYRAQGFATARDRFFQMDLIRRRTFGQLSEILGKALIPSDRLRRIYGFSQVAKDAVVRMDPTRRARLQAYADGVNAYLTAGPLPPEIRIVGYTPRSWTPEDSVAIVLSMYDPPCLEVEMVRTSISKRFPKSVVEFLTADYGFLEATMTPEPPTKLSVPDPSVFDPRRQNAVASPNAAPIATSKSPNGSNAWAIDGKLTESGMPILAGDPHLGLNLPNIWYRARLEAPGFSATGVALPGVPGIVIGTNGYVAWSFTNPFIDLADRVELHLVGTDSYLDGKQPVAFKTRRETIQVKGEPDEVLVVRVTKWGPVLEGEGTPYALQWVALDPAPLSQIDLTSMNCARNLQSALDALGTWAGPAHNVVIAAKDGIAWVIAGKVPNRVGVDATYSVVRTERIGWQGYIPREKLPSVIRPAQGWVANSNQRPIGVGPTLRALGAGWPVDGRAARIYQILGESKTKWTLERVKNIQLDITSPTHLWYRDRLVEALQTDRSDEGASIRKLVTSWDGSAALDSKAYPFLKMFRKQVLADLLEFTYREEKGQTLEYAKTELSRDAVVRALLENRSAHWLPKSAGSYEELLRNAAFKTLASVGEQEWGERNRAQVRHPFSAI